MKFIKIILLLLVVQLSFGQNNIEKIDSLITALHSNGKFNGSILIAEKGKVTYLNSLGFSNETTKEKLDENSIFDIASVSKQFTAMGIMILMENGALRLDDKLSKHIHTLANYENITIKNLLNHTSGLPDYMRVLAPLVDRTKLTTNKDLISLYSIHMPKLKFETGTKYEYSNTGYVLLASIIEKVSGMSYGQFLEKRIFKPLDMDRTFVKTLEITAEDLNNYAFGYLYSRQDKKYLMPNEIERAKQMFGWIATYGDGSINSTVLDLLKWDRALYTNKLISKKSLEEIFSPSYKNNTLLKNYGYGWDLKENKLIGKYVRHSGGWPGYVSEIERHIENDKTIIVLQNHYDAERPAKLIRNILYGKEIPKTMSQLFKEGKSIDAIIEFCQNPNTSYLVNGFKERHLNNFGYELLEKEKNKEALQLFILNTQLNPGSANAWDSLGECYLIFGEKYKKEGIKAYEKSLELNPDNENAKSILYNFTNTKKGLNILFKEGTDRFTNNQKILIDSILVTSENKVRNLLPNLPKDIKVTVTITNENVDQLGGVNGRTERNSPAEVIVEISKVYPGGITKAINTALAALIFHEFHHLSRGWAIYDNKYAQGISIATINEGLAVVFSETYTEVKLTGNSSSNVTKEWIEEIIALPKDANYSTWMFKHPDGRTAIGYRTGNFIVRQAMKNSGMDILEISKLSPDSIMKMAGY